MIGAERHDDAITPSIPAMDFFQFSQVLTWGAVLLLLCVFHLPANCPTPPVIGPVSDSTVLLRVPAPGVFVNVNA